MTDDPRAPGAVPPGATHEDPATLERRLAELQAQRDALQARVRNLESTSTTSGRIRGVAVFVVVVLACVAFTGAAAGVWARRSVLNNEVWADRVTPLVEDPDVQDALARYMTAEIMSILDPQQLIEDALPDEASILAGPLSSAVESFVADQSAKVVASDRFADLWERVLVQAHDTAVDILEGNSEVVQAQGDELVINLVPVMNQVLAELTSASPEIFGRTVDIPDVTVDDIPQDAIDKISDALGVDIPDDWGVIRVDDQGGTLAAAQDAVRLFDVAVYVLVALTIVLIPLALWLSRRRRRTLLQLTFGIAIGLVLLRRLALTVESGIIDRVRVEENVGAVQAVLDQFIDPLLDATELVLWVLVAIAVVAAVTGPYRWAVRLRHGAAQVGHGLVSTAGKVGARAQDEETIVWMREHLGALQAAGVGVAVLALLAFDLSWWGLFFLLLVLAGYQGVLWWATGPHDEEPPPPAAPGGDDGELAGTSAGGATTSAGDATTSAGGATTSAGGATTSA